jgi:hypothetical protein
MTRRGLLMPYFAFPVSVGFGVTGPIAEPVVRASGAYSANGSFSLVGIHDVAQRIGYALFKVALNRAMESV